MFFDNARGYDTNINHKELEFFLNSKSKVLAGKTGVNVSNYFLLDSSLRTKHQAANRNNQLDWIC